MPVTRGAAGTAISSTPHPNRDNALSSFGSALSENSLTSVVARSASPELQKPPKTAAEYNAARKRPTVLDMVCEAIRDAGESKKGISVQIIKKYVIAQYFPHDSKRLNPHFKSALQKGLEQGLLERPKQSSMTGARGFFKISKPKIPKPKKPAKDTDTKTSPSPEAQDLNSNVNRRRPKTASAPTKISTSPDGQDLNSNVNRRRPKIVSASSDTEVTIIKPDKRRSMKLHASDSELPDFENDSMKIMRKIIKKKNKPKQAEETTVEKPVATKEAKVIKTKKLYKEPVAGNSKENQEPAEKAKMPRKGKTELQKDVKVSKTMKGSMTVKAKNPVRKATPKPVAKKTTLKEKQKKLDKDEEKAKD